MSALQSAESISDTEIIFTSVPVYSEPQAQVEEIPEKSLPVHVEMLKSKLKTERRRKLVLAAHESKLQQLDKLVDHTETLNNDSEMYNTQSAVLLAALNKLQTDLEQSRTEKKSLAAELQQLKTSGQALITDLHRSQNRSSELNDKTESNNKRSDNLFTQLQELVDQSKIHRDRNAATTDQIQTTLQISMEQQEHLCASITEFSSIKDKALQFFREAERNKQSSEQRSIELDQAVAGNEVLGNELRELCKSVAVIKQELLEDKVKQTSLHQETKILNAETERQNLYSATRIEQNETQYEEMKQELAKSLGLNKKYQARLMQVEEKLKEAAKQQQQYQGQYEKALQTLEQNKELLDNASKSLAESNGRNEVFNESLAQFQHTNEQSQHLVLRSQTTLDNLLSRNQILERENKSISERVGTMNLGSMNAVGLNTNALNASGLNPSGLNPSGLNKGVELDKPQGMPSIDELQLNDSLSNSHIATAGNAGFFKLMMILAVILPLSFIAHSVISAMGELQSASNTSQITRLNPEEASFDSCHGVLQPASTATVIGSENHAHWTPAADISELGGCSIDLSSLTT